MRIDSLDGLRAVAILSVLFLHHHFFNNGWMGVDLFFVLSGFLITQILRKNRREAAYWKPFYIKRTTRILPPMVLTIVIAYIFTPGSTFLAALGYLLSLGGLITVSKYQIAPLGPLWSLAVEEHFYLLWPFAVRFLPRRSLIMILGALLTAVPCLRLAFSHPTPMATLSPIYFLTPFRIDEMAFGCLLAVLAESEQLVIAIRRWSGWLFLTASGLYLSLWVGLHHVKFFPGAHTKLFDSSGYSLIGLICCAAIAYVRFVPASYAARMLSMPPLAWIGRISYGVYLYHLLIKNLVMWSTGITSERVALFLDLPLVLFISWLSFRYFESPIMKWGNTRAAEYRAAAELNRRGKTLWSSARSYQKHPRVS